MGKDARILQETHDAVLILKTKVKSLWQAVMGLYAIMGSIGVGLVVAHALSK